MILLARLLECPTKYKVDFQKKMLLHQNHEQIEIFYLVKNCSRHKFFCFIEDGSLIAILLFKNSIFLN